VRTALLLLIAVMLMLSPSLSLDGIDISKIGLEDLRSRITIVSQDVALFSGTLRSNIDVFNEHDDQECWDVIERCHLKPLLTRSSSDGIPSLDFPINATNSLSAGECQLIALARAILRRPSFIIFDEATSQIDSTLDDHVSLSCPQSFRNLMTNFEKDPKDDERRVCQCDGVDNSAQNQNGIRLRPYPRLGQWESGRI
jgi:ABC-type multidrug transport system fused ATPase/permease subunit